MERVLSLYLPGWAVQRWRRRRVGGVREAGGRPRYVLLVRTVGHRQVVVYACGRSRRAGVTPGMTLAHARALLPGGAKGGNTSSVTRTRHQGTRHVASRDPVDLLIREHDPAGDRAALHRLARWANRFAPAVMPDPHGDGLLMDVTGCARLYRGEANLLRQLHTALARLGLTAAIAIAPTLGAAWALARHLPRHGPAEHRIVDRLEALPDVLAPLPVGALRLDDDTLDALAELGVRRIGQLLDLPRSELPSRFSDELVLRLDQALGRAMETITPLRVAPPPTLTQSFAGPVTDFTAIQQAARQLLDRLAAQLLAREAGVSDLRLTLQRYQAPPVELRLTLSRPTRDAQHLWHLLQPRLESAHLGHGVEALVARAATWARLPHEQLNQPGIHDHVASRTALDAERARLLDTLLHRLGPGRVLRMQHVPSHLPERAIRHIPANSAPPHPSPSAHPPSAIPHPPSLPRPTQLLDPPEPVQVQALTPDGPVLQLTWRGQTHRVTQCTGPERITHAWWHEPTGSRDYFRIALDIGLHLWLYRDNRRNRWFLHGWWA